MKIAKQLKDTNICEYLLYMWQLEDTLRAYDCEADRLRSEYVDQFGYDETDKEAEAQWLEALCRMMREENCLQRGHLQINRGTMTLLTDLHQTLLMSPRHPFYSAAYYRALPFIVEVRSRSGHTDTPELENCFEALYGTMLLRLQKRTVTADTAAAVTQISHLLSLLADAWNKERQGELEV